MNALLKSDVEKVLAQVRPYIQSDGGDVELVDIDERDGTVAIRLTGACRGCSSAHITVFDGIQAALQGQLGWVRGVEQVHGDQPAQAATPTITRWVEDQYAALLAAARAAASEESPGARQTLLAWCERDFERLLAVEDQCLHAAFETALGLTHSPVAMLRHEHKDLRDRLAQLQAASGVDFETRAGALLAALESHWQKEKSAVWPFINNALPEDLARELQDDIQRFVISWKPLCAAPARV
ncbi:MAG: NifU family protein [Planctomycetes bacterium]|nr:NifU family protein [Planctomycetota bacterium]